MAGFREPSRPRHRGQVFPLECKNAVEELSRNWPGDRPRVGEVIGDGGDDRPTSGPMPWPRWNCPSNASELIVASITGGCRCPVVKEDSQVKCGHSRCQSF